MDLSFYQLLFLIITCLVFLGIGIIVLYRYWKPKIKKLKNQRDALTEFNEAERKRYKKNLLKASDANRKLKNENLMIKEQLYQEKEWFKELEGRGAIL